MCPYPMRVTGPPCILDVYIHTLPYKIRCTCTYTVRILQGGMGIAGGELLGDGFDIAALPCSALTGGRAFPSKLHMVHIMRFLHGEGCVDGVGWRR